MKTLAEFEQYYSTDLRQLLNDFEKQRKTIILRFLWSVCAILAIAAVVLLFISSLPVAPAIIITVVVGTILAALMWWLLTRNFVLEFKKEIISRIVTFCEPTMKYDPKRHISQSEFQASAIFKHRIDRYRGEDHVHGRIGATDIAFSELHAEYRTTSGSGKNRRTEWHTIFKGLFCIADFNKEFHGATVVLPQSLNFLRSGQLVNLEDPEFEKEFVVYGDDQIEARYILSTSLMQRITAFKRKTGKQLYLSFTRSNVYVAVTTSKNMFEPRIFRTLLDFDMAREYLEDLQLAVGIVEDLNLNTRIWTKE